MDLLTKEPSLTDRHVGSRMRMRRKMLGMSQEKLAKALGLTFQQVQKYEKGANRIGAGRLQQISDILQVPIAFFYEGASDKSAPAGSDKSMRSVALLDDFVSSREGLRLVQSFMRIESASVPRAGSWPWCRKLLRAINTRSVDIFDTPPGRAGP
jgi:transcriptional regulator with XRE-family HTH domain